MKRIGIAPKVRTIDSPANNEWFQTVGDRMNVYEGAADPVASEVPEGQWIVYRNTSLNEVRIWTKIAGTVLKSAALT